MWTRLIWGFLVIIFAWRCGSAGAYRLLDSLDEGYESCPAVKINAQHKTFYNVHNVHAGQDQELGKQTCDMPDKQNKPVKLLLRIINLTGIMRDPPNIIMHRPKAQARAEFLKENPSLEQPKRKMILILNQRPEVAEKENRYRFM